MTKDNGSSTEQFREQGYLVVEGLLSAEEVQQVRQRTEDLITGAVPGFPAADIELEPAAMTMELATVRKLNRPRRTIRCFWLTPATPGFWPSWSP